MDFKILKYVLAAVAGLWICPRDLRADSEKSLLQAWVKEQKESCAPSKTVFKKGHLTRRDVNGDGINDFILDTGYVDCQGQGSLFCGSGGCDTTIFASIGGGEYVKAFSGLVRDVKFKTVKGRPAMALTTHGSGCGKIGAENCETLLFWNGKLFSAR